jgi:hypothetical protein
MKNYKKGSATLVLLIIAVLVVGGGVYYYYTQQNSTDTKITRSQCEQLVKNDKSVSEINECYEKSWKTTPQTARSTKMLCERPEVQGIVTQVFKKNVPLNVDTDNNKETLVSCGYNEDIGGAGSDLLTYIVDDNNGDIIKKLSAVGGEQIGGPIAMDVNGDNSDEVLWSSGGCAMGYGCGITYHIYDVKTDQDFSLDVVTEKGDNTKVGQKTYSSNLSEAQNKVFRDFLNSSAMTKIPKPVLESKR